MSKPKTKRTKAAAPNERILKEARAYIPNILRVCINDCSDSGEQADRHQARFDALVDDQIGIGQFIKENLLDEWVAEAKRTIKESGYPLEGWVTEPPAPLDDLSLLND